MFGSAIMTKTSSRLEEQTDTMSNLQRAIEIAVLAHKEQTRKDGSPYILHPLRLMLAVDSIPEKIVAVLHDVVEDTDVTEEQLQSEGFSDEILQALKAVTHDEDQPYEDYIKAIKRNPIAKSVKLADLRDNSNTFEIPDLKEKDLQAACKISPSVQNPERGLAQSARVATESFAETGLIAD